MPDGFTLREIADKIASLDGLNADAAHKQYQQLRVMYQKGLMVPTSSKISRGKVARYDQRTFCIVRHMIILYELGIDAASLREAFNNTDFSNGPSNEIALDKAIEGTKQGEEWFFEIIIRRDPKTGEREIKAYFRPTEQTKKARAILKGIDPLGHVTIPLVARIELPTSALIKPIMDLPVSNESE